MNNFEDMMQQQINGALGALGGVSQRYQSGMTEALDRTTNDVGQWRDKMSALNYNPQIGALKASAAMLAPTKTGGFGESLGGALSAMGDSKQDEQNFGMDKYQKMALMDEALGKLRQHRAGVEYDTMNSNINSMGVLGNQNNNLMNQKFDREMQPYKVGQAQFQQEQQPYVLAGLKDAQDRNQADVDFQPLEGNVYMDADGNFDYAKGAQETYKDYLANPQKYRGPQGQKTVSDAMQVLQDKQRTDAQLEAAGIRANRNGKGGHDVGTMKAIREIDDKALRAERSVGVMSGIEKALEGSSSGYFADTRNFVRSMGGGEDGSKASMARQAISTMEGISLEQYSDFLKPLSETDAQWAKGVLGDASASSTQKAQAVRMARIGLQIQAAEDKARARAMRSKTYYEDDINDIIANDKNVQKLYKQRESLWTGYKGPKPLGAGGDEEQGSGGATYNWTPDGGLQ